MFRRMLRRLSKIGWRLQIGRRLEVGLRSGNGRFELGVKKIQKKTVSGMGKNRGRVTGGVCERWRRMIGECEL